MDAIVIAATRVLLEDGYPALTTNRVAKEAGCSVGSLYQYFPNREALVLAVTETHMQRMLEAFGTRFRAVAHADVEEALSQLIGGLVDMYRVQPRLHRALFEEVPRIGELNRLRELHNRYLPLVIAWLEENRGLLEVSDLSSAAWVLVSAVENVVSRALMERPELVASGELERVVVRLVLGYLAPSRLVQKPPRRRARPR